MDGWYGISPKFVSSFCEKYDIAHYALVVKQFVSLKTYHKNRNHKALVYFAVKNHMYLILDEAVRNHWLEEQK